MPLRTISCDPLDDGWTEPAVSPRRAASRPLSDLRAGDTVLYRIDGKLTPAIILGSAGISCWLARDARHAQGLIYLDTESITARLPGIDLLGD